LAVGGGLRRGDGCDGIQHVMILPWTAGSGDVGKASCTIRSWGGV
jgi:hypothetical protein